MRGLPILASLGVCWLAAIGTVQGGVYNLDKPLPGPSAGPGGIQPLPFGQMRDLVGSLVTIDVPNSTLGKQYRARQQELEAKFRRGPATPEDCINLSADLIRLRKYDEAVGLLTPVAGRERRNYRILANLGTAHQLSGRPVPAIEYLMQVRDVWPREEAGTTAEQLAWGQRAESYHLKLLRLRLQEVAHLAPGERPKNPETVDDLFTVQFVGDSGKFEAGKLAADQRTKLPGDAVALVQQLLIWLPDDTRLYWLLGEVYNAQGDVTTAATIFAEECVSKRHFDAPLLREHRRIVQEARPSTEPLVPPVEDAPAAPASPGWLPHRAKILGAGAVVGLLVALLLYLQFREFRRRRRESPGRVAR
jgi:hypothetical protein